MDLPLINMPVNMPDSVKAKSRKKARIGGHVARDAGFVLPYVLIVIAIIAIVASIAAERLRRTLNTVSQIQEQSRLDLNFHSVEADTIFALMTASPVENGYDLNPFAPRATDFGYFAADGVTPITKEEFENIEKNIWTVDRGLRKSGQYERPVIIELQDVTGLVSWNNAPNETLEKILRHIGIPKDKAASLLGKLGDYKDSDNRRQFRGAERADYRLRKLPPPSNSPIRGYNELYSIMGWEDALTPVQLETLKDWTSFESHGVVRKNFAPKDLSALLFQTDEASDSFDDVTSILDRAETNSVIASGKWRLTYWQRLDSGAYAKRVREVVQQVDNIEAPFRKFWVYEKTVLGDTLPFNPNELSEIKDVFTAPPANP